MMVIVREASAILVAIMHLRAPKVWIVVVVIVLIIVIVVVLEIG